MPFIILNVPNNPSTYSFVLPACALDANRNSTGKASTTGPAVNVSTTLAPGQRQDVRQKDGAPTTPPTSNETHPSSTGRDKKIGPSTPEVSDKVKSGGADKDKDTEIDSKQLKDDELIKDTKKVKDTKINDDENLKNKTKEGDKSMGDAKDDTKETEKKDDSKLGLESTKAPNATTPAISRVSGPQTTTPQPGDGKPNTTSAAPSHKKGTNTSDFQDKDKEPDNAKMPDNAELATTADTLPNARRPLISPTKLLTNTLTPKTKHARTHLSKKGKKFKMSQKLKDHLKGTFLQISSTLRLRLLFPHSFGLHLALLVSTSTYT